MNADGQLTPTTERDTRIILMGGWLFGARAAWVIAILTFLGIFVYSLPLYYADMLASPAGFFLTSWGPEEVRPALESINLPITVYVGFVIVTNIIVAIISGVFGVVIFLRRSNEVMGLFTSFVLAGLGMAISESFQALPLLAPQLTSLVIVIYSGYLLSMSFFLLIFPDGRLVSPWMRVGFGLVVGYLIIASLLPTISLLEWDKGSNLAITFLIWGMAAYSQIHRFRTNTNLVLRQQIKWLAMSLLSLLVIFVIVFSAFALLPALRQAGGTQIILLMSALLVSSILMLMIPVSIGIAIMRYRLWDIDIVINRSIVYGSLTLLLGIVFVGGFFGVRAVLGNFLSGSQGIYPAILSTALVVGLFSPTRRRLRRFVDQRFYGIDLDYSEAAKQEAAQRKAIEKEGPISTFGKYKALGLIGRGGMGEVYKAGDPATGETVAIKTLYIRGEADREELVKRFHREAQAIEGLQHENIVKLIDYGEQEEIPYMVMEYIEGESLSQRIREDGRLPLDETVQILNGVASALDYAHGQGLVHRDIKPSNVIVEHVEGKPPRAVLMDFGIARMVSAMTALTGTGGMVGTLDYIAPEQIQGAHQVDGRADVYSMGVMAYQMVTGELPFKHKNPGALIMAHLSTPAPDAREVVKGLPRGAAKAIQQAMAKEAEDRFETAGAFVTAMRS